MPNTESSNSPAWLTAIFLIVGPLQASADTTEEQLSILTNGLPTEIREFIQRRIGCNHWFGETATDASRKDQIETNLKALGCSYVRRDERILRLRYMQEPRALKALEQTKDWLPQ